MMNKLLLALGLVALNIYLFVTAPPPLETQAAEEKTLPVTEVFKMLQNANAAARLIWTRDIVGKGIEAGLKFSEHWTEEGIEAGPLPALFLRESARILENLPLPISLYLGSDMPINPANRFVGNQLDHFLKVRGTQSPQFFFDHSTDRHVAMFPDVAVAQPCVTCHNNHPKSPKKDWQMNDVMGATTWAYPKKHVPLSEAVRLVSMLHQAQRQAYLAYLNKAASFSKPPRVDREWPEKGCYCLPDVDTFMAKVIWQASPKVLAILLRELEKKEGENA